LAQLLKKIKLDSTFFYTSNTSLLQMNT